MKSRKGFTLAELMVVLVIVLIFGMLIFGRGGCTGYYKQTQTGIYKCVKTYTVTTGGSDSTSTSKRVDLRPQSGGQVETMRVDDDIFVGQYNSATIYAQFEPGKWYSVTSTGFRQEGMIHFFPLVTNVSPVPDPTQ